MYEQEPEAPEKKSIQTLINHYRAIYIIIYDIPVYINFNMYTKLTASDKFFNIVASFSVHFS